MRTPLLRILLASSLAACAHAPPPAPAPAAPVASPPVPPPPAPAAAATAARPEAASLPSDGDLDAAIAQMRGVRPDGLSREQRAQKERALDAAWMTLKRRPDPARERLRAALATEL